MGDRPRRKAAPKRQPLRALRSRQTWQMHVRSLRRAAQPDRGHWGAPHGQVDPASGQGMHDRSRWTRTRRAPIARLREQVAHRFASARPPPALRPSTAACQRRRRTGRCRSSSPACRWPPVRHRGFATRGCRPPRASRRFETRSPACTRSPYSQRRSIYARGRGSRTAAAGIDDVMVELQSRDETGCLVHQTPTWPERDAPPTTTSPGRCTARAVSSSGRRPPFCMRPRDDSQAAQAGKRTTERGQRWTQRPRSRQPGTAVSTVGRAKPPFASSTAPSRAARRGPWRASMPRPMPNPFNKWSAPNLFQPPSPLQLAVATKQTTNQTKLWVTRRHRSPNGTVSGIARGYAGDA